MKRLRSWGLIMSRLNQNQRNAIKALQNLAKHWPDGISLFTNSGSLLVISDDLRIVKWIEGIPTDGGDPGTYRRNNEEYLSVGKK